jgi:hypothetical protein
MPQDPFPARGADGEEPDGSAALPARGTGPGGAGPDDDWDADAHIEALLAAAEAGEDEAPPEEEPEGPAQGLYVCLPAEQLTLAGFARGGQADTMTPGPADLVAAAARHPATRWCLTALRPDGTAAAHSCAPGRHPACRRGHLRM